MTSRVLLLVLLLGWPATAGDDWPMWRYDASRSGAAPHALPENLEPAWSRTFGARKQAWDDPLNLDLMSYDRLFEPIVMDGRMFVGFNDQDKVIAIDVSTGRTLWTFYTDGPVRFPAAGFNGSVFFVSDDGYLYCVDAATGRQRWKFRGGPGARKALGNQRITSAWPARGGPVIRDGNVYFAASIWPFMGIFIYSLDAETGAVDWVNDELGAQYIRQPHSAPSFAGVAPQGAMVATEKYLVVPGGRSVPAVLDRATGKLKYFEINAGGKGNGGSLVIANEQRFFVHTRRRGTRAFDLKNGTKTAFETDEPVLYDDMAWSAAVSGGKPVVRALLANLPDQVVKKDQPDPRLVWEMKVDASGDLIRVGSQLVAAGKTRITVIDLPELGAEPAIASEFEAGFAPQRLVAAASRLFAIGLDGTIAAFAPANTAVADLTEATNTPSEANPADTKKAATLASLARAEGFGLWYGAAGHEGVIAELGSRFRQLAVVDPNGSLVQTLRQSLDARNLYGRVTAHISEFADFQAPPYIAHMVFVGEASSVAVAGDPAVTRTLYESVRPYGGVMQLLVASDQRDRVAAAVRQMKLPQAEVRTTEEGVLVQRVGRLPGSADWTHQYGDIANTVKSDDARVRLPLGILWFGGPSNMDVLPRHGHGPPEQVIGGRLFIQGHNSLSARDVYTGRVLWKREFKDLGTFDVYYDESYENTPLNPKYNQNHIPGANARGTNYVATPDLVYIVEGATCHALNPATGKTEFDIALPQETPDNPVEWGFIGVFEDVLIGGVGFAQYRKRLELTFPSDKARTGNAIGFGSKSFDRAASRALVGFDRHTGKQLWRVDAKHSFWHNGIVAGNGTVFCLDKKPHAIEEALKRRGKEPPKTYRIVAVDHRTGDLRWERTEGIFGTWLGLDTKRNLLLQAGARASDRLTVEVGKGMAVYHAADGSLAWEKPKLSYTGPCILHNDYIITNTNSYAASAGAFRITDGQQRMVENPLTGEMQPWKMSRAYGCNNIIACEHLLTFRSGAAGFYDLETDSGTGNLGGFKSGCTSNLVVANGVLNAPDYTRTCSCAYQNQTSLALVHMPELELWTVNHDAIAEVKNKRIEHIGINFGAPGDRRDNDGTLWLEYPVVAGDSPPLQIDFKQPQKWVRQHPSSMSSADVPWIQASGILGPTELEIGMLLEEPVDLKGHGIELVRDSDDAEENTDGNVNFTSSDLEIVHDSEDQLIGLRFPRVPIDRGAKIKSAFIQFTSDEVSDEVTELTIQAVAAGDTPPFAAKKHDISGRPRTAESVKWAPPKWEKAGLANAAQRTTDVADLVRAVTSREDWEPGNAIAFVISGKGRRVAKAARGRTNPGARLIVKAPQVKLKPEFPVEPRPYGVRLYFCKPRESEDAVFDVFIQGKRVASDVKLDATLPAVVLPAGEQPGFRTDIGEKLNIRLEMRSGAAALSGVRLKHEDQK